MTGGASPELPHSLGRYSIDRLLGQGGMGIVYAAHDPSLARAVALKLLRGEADADARARLLREARAMARLSHPNVVAVYEVSSADDRDFVAMELIDGVSLDRWLATARPPDQILDALVQAGRGLAAAHDRGLVHRDFKPHNVLVARDGRVVVTDFGLARAADEGRIAAPVPGPAPVVSGVEETLAPAASASPAVSTTLTATGALIGTPAYMAPEQWAGAACDARTDQFAFCLSLWEALAGARPYRGDNLDDLRASVAAGPPTDAERVPGWLLPVLRRGLAPAPADRWPSMAALLATIERGRHRRRRRALVAAGGGLVAAAAVGIALVATRGGTTASGDAVCRPTDEAAAELWSATRLARAREQFADHPTDLTALDGRMSRMTATWRDSYQHACADHADRHRLTRVACLEAWRDHLVEHLDAIEQLPAGVASEIQHDDVLPPIGPCLAEIPIPPAPAPAPAQRAAVRAQRVQSLIMMFGPARDDEAAWAAQEDAARTVGYPPLVIEIQMIRALIAWRRGDFAVARERYQSLEVAAEEAGVPMMRANALVALAELGVDGALPDDQLDAIFRRARAAIFAAGDDPVMASVIDNLDAQRASQRGDHAGALEVFERTLATRIVAGDHRRAANAAAQLAQALVARGEPGDRDRARQVLIAEMDRQRALLGDRALALPGLQFDLDALPPR